MIKILNRQFEHSQIIITLLFLYIGVVYFSIALSNIILGITCFVFVLGLYLKKIQLNFTTSNWKKYVIILAPFLLTILSVAYSENTTYGFKYIWLRLPILVLPFIMVFMEVKTTNLKKGIMLFVILTISASLVTIYNAIQYFNEDVLFVSDFTFFITIIQHPYLGVFVLIAFVSIIEFKLMNYKPLKILVLAILFLAMALTTSRLVYLLFLAIVASYMFKHLSNKRALFLSILLMGFSILFVISNPSLRGKFQSVFKYENSPRLKLWNNAFKVVNTEHNNLLLGVGVGDYYQDKKEVYFFKENKQGIKGYNPHSQFIEYYVTNGIVGVALLTIITFLGILRVKHHIRFSIIIFTVIIMFAFTESIFSRQYGVQLYSIFIPLIFSRNYKRL